MNTRMFYNGSGSRGTEGNIWSFPDTPAASLPPKLLYYVIPYSQPFLYAKTVYDNVHVYIICLKVSLKSDSMDLSNKSILTLVA